MSVYRIGPGPLHPASQRSGSSCMAQSDIVSRSAAALVNDLPRVRIAMLRRCCNRQRSCHYKLFKTSISYCHSALRDLWRPGNNVCPTERLHHVMKSAYIQMVYGTQSEPPTCFGRGMNPHSNCLNLRELASSRMSLREWEQIIRDVPGSSFTCVSPRCYDLVLSPTLTISFFIPQKYPAVPPLYEIHGSAPDADARLASCCRLGQPPFLVSWLVRGSRARRIPARLTPLRRAAFATSAPSAGRWRANGSRRAFLCIPRTSRRPFGRPS
jgi:hypothetical protein